MNALTFRCLCLLCVLTASACSGGSGNEEPELTAGAAEAVGPSQTNTNESASDEFDRAALVRDLTDSGFTEVEASCVVDRLLQDLGFDRLTDDGDPTEQEEALITATVEDCTGASEGPRPDPLFFVGAGTEVIALTDLTRDYALIAGDLGESGRISLLSGEGESTQSIWPDSNSDDTTRGVWWLEPGRNGSMPEFAEVSASGAWNFTALVAVRAIYDDGSAEHALAVELGDTKPSYPYGYAIDSPFRIPGAGAGSFVLINRGEATILSISLPNCDADVETTVVDLDTGEELYGAGQWLLYEERLDDNFSQLMPSGTRAQVNTNCSWSISEG